MVAPAAYGEMGTRTRARAHEEGTHISFGLCKGRRIWGKRRTLGVIFGADTRAIEFEKRTAEERNA